MGGSFPFIDIILFAVLALFLVYRLSTVLGRRGDDQEPSADQNESLNNKAEAADDNVVTISERGEQRHLEEDLKSSDPLIAGLAAIRKADPSFREREFLKGARAAFEMIVGAFAEGNGKILKSLLDGPVYENFATAIREREKAGHSLETTLVGIEEAEITGAEMRDRNVRVTVKFVSGQVNATTDSSGDVVEGDSGQAVQVTDIWTFQRDARTADPNWVLAATGSPD